MTKLDYSRTSMTVLVSTNPGLAERQGHGAPSTELRNQLRLVSGASHPHRVLSLLVLQLQRQAGSAFQQGKLTVNIDLEVSCLMSVSCHQRVTHFKISHKFDRNDFVWVARTDLGTHGTNFSYHTAPTFARDKSTLTNMKSALSFLTIFVKTSLLHTFHTPGTRDFPRTCLRSRPPRAVD